MKYVPLGNLSSVGSERVGKTKATLDTPVLRFRSSPHFAATSHANFGT
jgi:hypothetical protein